MLDLTDRRQLDEHKSGFIAPDAEPDAAPLRPHLHYRDTDRRAAYKRLLLNSLLNCTVKAAMALRAIRDANAPHHFADPAGNGTASLALIARLQERKILVSLGKAVSDVYASRAKDTKPRCKNFDRPEATTDPLISFRVDDINRGRYSRRCTYTRWTYRPIVHSAALILSPRVISWRLGDAEPRHITCPPGFSWRAEKVGLALVFNRDPKNCWRILDAYDLISDAHLSLQCCELRRTYAEDCANRRQAREAKRAERWKNKVNRPAFPAPRQLSTGETSTATVNRDRQPATSTDDMSTHAPSTPRRIISNVNQKSESTP